MRVNGLGTFLRCGKTTRPGSPGWARPLSRGLVVCATFLAACGHHDATTSDATTQSAALTSAQISAGRNAGLLPSPQQVQFEWIDPVPPTGVAASNVTVSSIGPDGTVIGGSYDPAVAAGVDTEATPVEYGLIKDSTGEHSVPGVFADGSTVFSAIGSDGTIYGWGGPASGESKHYAMEAAFARHPDGTYQLLNAPQRFRISQIVAENGPGSPIVVGDFLDDYGGPSAAGPIAHWLFDGDGTDQFGYSSFTTIPTDFGRDACLDGIAEYPCSDGTTPPQFLRLDGSACFSVPYDLSSPIGQTFKTNTGYVDPQGGGPGATVMAWIRIPRTACASGPGLRVLFNSNSTESTFGIKCESEGPKLVESFYGVDWTDTSNEEALPYDTWVHVALTWDHHVMRTYINGREAGFTDQRSGGWQNWVRGLAVGCGPWAYGQSYNFIGDVRDLSAIRRPLAPDQILQYLNGKKSDSVNPGAGWARYRMSEDHLPEFSLVPYLTDYLGPKFPWWGGRLGGAAPDGTMVGFANYYDPTNNGAVERHATIYRPSNGLMTLLDSELPTNSGWVLERAGAINSSRVIAGVGAHGGQRSAFKFDPARQTITDLGHMSVYEAPSVADFTYWPTSINAAGNVAGYSMPYPWLMGHAWVYTDASGMTDLNDLIPQDQRTDPVTGTVWTLITANINDANQVAGVAQNAAGTGRGYKITLPGLPSPAQIECAGLADGTPCTHGTFCPDNNVCFGGACGGMDPADAVCLHTEGVVQVAPGEYRAIFSYENKTPDTVLPAPNRELIDGLLIASPNPTPPEWLPPGHNVGAYKPNFTGSQKVSWRANGQIATASASQSTSLPKVADGSGYGAWVGGDPGGTPPDNGATFVQLQADLGAWAALPDREPHDGQLAAAPDYASLYNGTLNGSLSVTPTGAVTYTVPISVPPGVAGMAPNLSLVYNSQGGNGLAGQGWDLAGLSMVYRCASTMAQDYGAVPVRISRFDGVCLDGKHLWEDPLHNGEYTSESRDFTAIRRFPAGSGAGGIDAGTQIFKVTLKNGETRYYGARDTGRVQLPIGDPYHGTPDHPIVAWLLDRVVDAWGNYFDIHYNFDNGNNFGSGDFGAEGIRVTEIDYTGHIGTTTAEDQPTFNKVTFDYEARQDVRRVRLGSVDTFFANPAPTIDDVTFPRKYRLTKITTNAGAPDDATKLSYELTYKPADPTHMLPSQLASIQYCARPSNPFLLDPEPKTCTGSLDFGWQGGGYEWVQEKSVADAGGQANTFALPDEIDWAPGVMGNQFVDVNADGRVDFVSSRPATSWGWPAKNIIYLNNGHGWSAGPGLPSVIVPGGGTEELRLAKLDSAGHLQQSDVRFADMDGDGVLDLVANENPDASETCYTDNGQICNAKLGGCIPGRTHCYPNASSPGIWLSNQVSFHSADFGPGTFGDGSYPDFTNGQDSLVDMDGDGRADIIRLGHSGIDIIYNTPTGWVKADRRSSSPESGCWNDDGRCGTTFPVPTSEFQLQDLDNDGVPELVGKTWGHHPGWASRIPSFGLFKVGAPDAAVDSTSDEVVSGDIDGDGYPDTVVRHHTAWNSNVWKSGIVFSNGNRFTKSNAASYENSMDAFIPRPDEGIGQLYFSLADLNADGLADLILDHEGLGVELPDYEYWSGGQVLVNTGNAWADLNGKSSSEGGSQWDQAAGDVGTRVPIMPFGRKVSMGDSHGAAFVDLNGDGVVDLVQGAGPNNYDHHTWRQAWLNQFKPPVIKAFPNGLAAKTLVSYAVITTAEARPSVYKESGHITTPNTKFIAPPLNVVSSVVEEDGSGLGMRETRYQYEDLRASTVQRGPQGFSRVTATETVHEPAMSRDTVTTVVTEMYQSYPYTGVAHKVTKYRGGTDGTKLSETTTDYCDFPIDDGDDSPVCTPTSGGVVPARQPVWVHPVQVKDESYLFDDNGHTVDTMTLTTTFRHDGYGNPTSTTVQSHSANGGTFTKVTTQFYDSIIERQAGTPNSTTVVSSQDGVPSATVTHTTAYEYNSPDSWSDPDINDGTHQPQALHKVIVEPDAGVGVRLDTAYDHDTFGNVTTITSCDAAFTSCGMPEQTGPPDHPFRISQVSYNPSDYAPGGAGHGLTPGYRAGRFPVMTTNALGHKSYSLYEETFGQKVVQIDPNHVGTCFNYSLLGRQTEQIDRCSLAGLDSGVGELKTTIQVFLAPASTGASTLTITTPPTGSPAWVYGDDQGRAIRTRKYGFDGHFVDTYTVYDPFGRTIKESKPYLVSVEVPAVTETTYDGLGRVSSVKQDLGAIDASGVAAYGLTQVSYSGLTTTTTKAVAGETTSHTRTEKKNSLGKVVEVTDGQGEGVNLKFTYDADGNILDADAKGAHSGATFDERGRKKTVTDPDSGLTTFTYDGYGDVVSQEGASGSATMTYDLLGRLTSRSNGDGTSTWYYDRTDYDFGAGIGRLSAVVGPVDANLNGSCATTWNSSGADQQSVKEYKYDTVGELVTSRECADGQDYATFYEYDLGRRTSMTYPGGNLKLSYHYTSLGYLQYIEDAFDQSAYWVATAMNGSGQVTSEYTRNGVETVSNRNTATGWLMGSTSTSHGNEDLVIQNWSYQYNETGSLTHRDRNDDVSDGHSNETFIYEGNGTDRLWKAETKIPSSGYDQVEEYLYYSNGNIKQKGNVSRTYTYGNCSAGPHAVCSDGTSTFTYDDHGNMLNDGNRTIFYNTSNKVKEIDSTSSMSGASDAAVVKFAYDGDGNRVLQQVSTNNGQAVARTTYVGLGATGKSLVEVTSSGASVERVDFIYADGAHGGNPFAVRTTPTANGSSGTPSTSYYHFDHLGSITAISDDQGQVVSALWGGAKGEQATVLGYDAWGARRTPNGTSAVSNVFSPQAGHREFTGHERIPSVDLINMNGRVYDPALGRFLSPDPSVQYVTDLQNHNRYSYVNNNPLTYTDPTGYFFDKAFDASINIGLTVLATACVASAGYGCGAYVIAAAIYNAASMMNNGAGFEQVVMSTTFSVVAGGAMGDLGTAYGEGALGTGYAGKIVGGAAGSVLSSVMMAPAGKGTTGRDILLSALQGAAMGAFAASATPPKVSQASTRTGEKSKPMSSKPRVIGRVARASGYGPDAIPQLEDIPGCNSSPCDLPGLQQSSAPNLELRGSKVDTNRVYSSYPRGWAFGLQIEGDLIGNGGGTAGWNLEMFSDWHVALFRVLPTDEPTGGFAYGAGISGNYSNGPGTPQSWEGPFVNYQLSFDVFATGYFTAPPGSGSDAWTGVSGGVGYSPLPISISRATTNYQLVLQFPP